MDVVIELVEEILSNYKNEIREGKSLEEILELLGMFSKVGWPKAQHLVLRLDEIFR
jgi:hypothetical protein